MNKDEIYGFIKIDDIDYAFLFSVNEFMLTVYPPGIDVWKEGVNDLLKLFGKNKIEHKWIDSLIIEGITSEGKSICFCVLDNPYNYNGFKSYIVHWVIFHSRDFDSKKIGGVRLSGGDINRFFPAEKALERSVNYDEESEIHNFQVASIHHDYYSCGKYRVEKHNDALVEANAGALLSYDNYDSPISAKSYMRISFDKETDVSIVIKTIRHIEQFMYYTFYRSNICIPDIEPFWWDDNSKRYYSGKIIITPQNELDLHKKAKSSVIGYDFWKNNMSKMLTEIKNEKIELNHICENIDKRSSYPPARFFSILSSFEREFRNIYGEEYLRHDAFKEEKDNLISLINDYADSKTGKRRKYIKEFTKIMQNHDDSYKDRVKCALLDCINIMEPFVQYHYNGQYNKLVEDISGRVGIMRNGFAHSRLDMKIKAINVTDIKIIEILLYAIRLKKYSKDEKLIKKSIAKLFCYNITI